MLFGLLLLMLLNLIITATIFQRIELIDQRLKDLEYSAVRWKIGGKYGC